MPLPAEFQSLVCAEAIAITAGIAAASIMRHGIAAHTSSVAKLCRKAVEATGPRRVLQIETNIAANTPAANSTHIPNTTSRILLADRTFGGYTAGRLPRSSCNLLGNESDGALIPPDHLRVTPSHLFIRP